MNKRRIRCIRLLSPFDLKAHEHTERGRVEEKSLCIMDGHHRRLATIHLGLAAVPVVGFTYDEVRVGSRRAGMEVEAEELIARAMSGALFPPGSTRHVFPPFESTAIPLAELLEAPPRV